MKKLLSVLLLLLCVVGAVSINLSVKDNNNDQETTSVMMGGLTFNNVPLTLKVGGTGIVIADIPLGYDSLRIEPNDYCLTFVNGNVIAVTAIKSTDGKPTIMRGTVSPLRTTRNLRDISGEFSVYVIK